MTNRKKRASLSGLAAFALILSMTGVVSAANADDVSGSEAVSVETTKEAPTEAPVEETKKAEEPPAPIKEAPAAPVVPVVPDPVVVDPAPPVEQPAPAPVVPEPVVVPVPAVPAAPVAPQVETPVAPELPAAPAKDVVIDDPAPVVVAPLVEEETPPGESESTEAWTINVQTFTHGNGRGQFLTYGTVPAGTPIGSMYGDFYFSLFNVEMDGPTHIGPRTTVNGTSIVQDISFWKCAKPGATYALVNATTGETVVGPVAVPGEVVTADPACGITTPTKETKYVTPGAPTFNPAGPGKHGSIIYPNTEGVVYTADPAGATEGPVKVTATAAPETADTIYVIAPGAQTEWSGNLGEFSEEVPNPGTPHEYASGGVEFAGKNSPATLVPFAGPFNDREYAYPEVKGTTHDGSPVTVNGKLQEVIGGVTVKDSLDLSQLCGKATWTWYAKADTEDTSPKWIINAGFIGGLPACDPQGGDDGGDNENPNPNPNPDPSHPGHGHGHGDDDGDHGDHDGCHSWNSHSCEPNNNGPIGTPGDLNNGGVEADASANNVVVQSSTVEELGMGNAIPEESDLSNVNSSNEDELAYTGSDDPLRLTVIGLGLFAMGLVLFSWIRPRKRK